MQMQGKRFTRFAQLAVACMGVAAGCAGPAGEASHPAELDGATTLSGLVTAQVRATDVTALARSLNPIVDTGGCSSTRVTIDTVEFADVAVAVAPTASGSDTRITVLAPVIRGQLQSSLLCLTSQSDFTVRADAYEIDGLVVPRLEGGRLAVAFQGSTGAFSGLSVELSGFPSSSAVHRLVDAVNGPLAGSLAQGVAAQLPTAIDDFLAGPGVRELTGPVAAALTDIDLTPALVAANPIANIDGDCFPVRASVTSVAHGPAEAALDPAAGGIATAVSLSALVVTGRLDYKVLCVSGSAPFSATADAYRATGMLTLGVDGTAVTGGFAATTSTLDGFALQTDGAIGSPASRVFEPLHDQLARLVGEQIARALASRVGPFFADFLSH
jgi:hypothetical protein